MNSRDLGRYLTALATALKNAPEVQNTRGWPYVFRRLPALQHATAGQGTPKEANCLLLTAGHAMSLHVQHKSKNGVAYFAVKVYDPEDTAHYIRVERPSPEALGDLTLESLLIRPSLISGYGQESNAPLSMVAVSMDHRLEPQMDTSATLASSANMHLALNCGLDEEVVRMFKSALLRSDLTPDAKIELLAAKRADGTPGLYMGLQDGQTGAVKEYVNSVLDSTLPDDAKRILLAAKGADRTPGLYIALEKDQTEAVMAYVDAVLESTLPEGKKIKLLAAKRADRTPGLYIALQKGQTEAVMAYVNAVLKSTLPPDSKIKLLAAKDANGTPGLLIARHFGHEATVNAYVAAVSESKLSADAKDELLKHAQA